MVETNKSSNSEEFNGTDKLSLVREVSILVAGKNTGPIVEILFDKKDVNEFLIAKKLNLTINQIRNVLYKLSDEGLVSFSRKKDKKKGWYTYFWTFNSEKAFSVLHDLINKQIGQAENQLNSRETKQFYVCSICKSELTEENALLHEFTCPECGEIYVLHDNSKVIKDIKGNIERLKKKMKIVEDEIKIIDGVKLKKVERVRKKQEKVKLGKRAEAAKKRAATRKANIKQKNKLKKKGKEKKVTKKIKKVVKKVKRVVGKKVKKN
ncbi:MAG: hypothetical protein ABIH59_01710 [archaeon]